MRFVLGAILLSLLSACSSNPDGCRTTQDCIDEKKGGTQCINGACVLPCVADADCGDRAQGSICEAGACVAPACDADEDPSGCPGTEVCVVGRCYVYFETFEPKKAGDAVSLENLPHPYNRVVGATCAGPADCQDGLICSPEQRRCVRALRNKATLVVWEGPPTCGPADDPDRCAGVAADGHNFVALERQSTPESGTPEYDVTCGACSCCLKCRDPLQREEGENSCLGVNLPNVAMCSATPPAECTNICNSCDSCVARTQRAVGFGDGLNMCQAQAAERRCPGCEAYDTCVKNKLTDGRACPGGAFPACTTAPQVEADCNACKVKECDNLRSACWNCRDAAQLKRDFPNQPDRWRQLEMDCQAAGNDACLPVAISIQRSALSDDEQSLESPEISLVGIGEGAPVLSFQYMPFDIGFTYRKVIQGQPRQSWPLVPQQVRVQLCAGSCERSASWVQAKLTNGKDAIFPSDDERQNGLQFALQSAGDWRIRHAEVELPEAMRTANFRFRFLPELADDARVGIDRIVIRRKL